jgi:excisionase family DNA binding protein
MPSRLGPYVALYDPGFRRIDVSEPLAVRLGYSTDELVGRLGWDPLIVDLDEGHELQIREELAEHGSASSVVILITAESERLHYAFTTRRLANGFYVTAGSFLNKDQAGRQSQPPKEVWMTRHEVSEHLKVSERTIDRWRKERGLPVHGTAGRRLFKLSELEAFLQGLE